MILCLVLSLKNVKQHLPRPCRRRWEGREVIAFCWSGCAWDDFLGISCSQSLSLSSALPLDFLVLLSFYLCGALTRRVVMLEGSWTRWCWHLSRWAPHVGFTYSRLWQGGCESGRRPQPLRKWASRSSRSGFGPQSWEEGNPCRCCDWREMRVGSAHPWISASRRVFVCWYNPKEGCIHATREHELSVGLSMALCPR